MKPTCKANGCYMFEAGSLERAACEKDCHLERPPVRVTRAGLAAAMTVVALASLGASLEHPRRTERACNPTACSTPEAHTVAPEDYLAWHAWAEKMQKTHRQIRCSGCGLFKVWVPQ